MIQEKLSNVVNLKICNKCKLFFKTNERIHVSYPFAKTFDEKRYHCHAPNHAMLAREQENKIIFINTLPQDCNFLLEQILDHDTIRLDNNETLTVDDILKKSKTLLDKEEDNGSEV